MKIHKVETSVAGENIQLNVLIKVMDKFNPNLSVSMNFD
jgi:hypothetical protein